MLNEKCSAYKRLHKHGFCLLSTKKSQTEIQMFLEINESGLNPIFLFGPKYRDAFIAACKEFKHDASYHVDVELKRNLFKACGTQISNKSRKFPQKLVMQLGMRIDTLLI